MNLKFEEVLLDTEIEEVKNFLEKFNLKYENDITYTLVCKDEQEIVGTASIANNIIKCFAVSCKYQGEGVALKIISQLLNVLNEKEIHKYFVFTTPNNIELFENMAFNLVASTESVCLLEGGVNNIEDELNNIKDKYKISSNPKAALVMNCNPMTLGHLYLIKKCARENEEVIIFVVEQNESVFPFVDRFEIVKKEVEKFKNVKVVPSTKYIISNITFPTYFLKEESNSTKVHAELDLLIFKKYFMPIFAINKRYVGSEPYCEVTSMYNQVIADTLKDKAVIIERAMTNVKDKDLAISASYVRDILKNGGDMQLLKKIVPSTTYDYLMTESGQKVIEKIKKSISRH